MNRSDTAIRGRCPRLLSFSPSGWESRSAATYPWLSQPSPSDCYVLSVQTSRVVAALLAMGTLDTYAAEDGGPKRANGRDSRKPKTREGIPPG